jgi:hypothetical protein
VVLAGESRRDHTVSLTCGIGIGRSVECGHRARQGPGRLALRGRVMAGSETRVQPGEPRTDHVSETDIRDTTTWENLRRITYEPVVSNVVCFKTTWAGLAQPSKKRVL